MVPIVLYAWRREQQIIQETICEQWKLEVAPNQRITQGMKVEIRSYECLNLIQGAMVMVRAGIIGKKVYWERSWAEYELVLDAYLSQSLSPSSGLR